MRKLYGNVTFKNLKVFEFVSIIGYLKYFGIPNYMNFSRTNCKVSKVIEEAILGENSLNISYLT